MLEKYPLYVRRSVLFFRVSCVHRSTWRSGGKIKRQRFNVHQSNMGYKKSFVNLIKQRFPHGCSIFFTLQLTCKLFVSFNVTIIMSNVCSCTGIVRSRELTQFHTRVGCIRRSSLQYNIIDGCSRSSGVV